MTIATWRTKGEREKAAFNPDRDKYAAAVRGETGVCSSRVDVPTCSLELTLVTGWVCNECTSYTAKNMPQTTGYSEVYPVY